MAPLIKQPLTLFRLAEEKELKPLPVTPFEIVTWHQAKVALDCHIQVSHTLYSVPYQNVGKRVDVKLGSKVGGDLSGLESDQDSPQRQPRPESHRLE